MYLGAIKRMGLKISHCKKTKKRNSMWRWMLTYRGRHFATDAASKTHVAQLKLTQWCRSTISWLQRWNTLPPQERTGVWIDLGRTPRQILQAKKRKEIAGPYVWLIPPMRGGETCLLGSCLHVNAREKVMPHRWRWPPWRTEIRGSGEGGPSPLLRVSALSGRF